MKVSSLRHKPTRQRLRPELGVGVRAVATGNYLIFYRVAPDTVSIVRVVHGSRNITADLFAE